MTISHNKTNQMHQLLKFIFGAKLYMFCTVPLSIIRSFSLHTQQWYMGERRGIYRVLVGKHNGRIILRWILRKWNVGVWTGLSWLRIGTDFRHL